MTSNNIYHYVYRITNLVEKKHYYGKRTSKIAPKLDIGFKYFSSSTDKEFMLDQKLNPQNYKYKVIAIFNSSKEALSREIKMHFKFDVKENDRFYNKVKQTSSGFDRAGVTGFVTVRDSSGNCFNVNIEDERYISGELKHIAVGSNKGKILVIGSDGIKIKMDKNDERILSGEYKIYNTMAGKIIVLDKNGNKHTVLVTDPEYLNGNLVSVIKGSKKEYRPNTKCLNTVSAYDMYTFKSIKVSSNDFYENRERYIGSKRAKNLGLI